MSRKGNCWDNAAMESFFGTVKDECVGSTIYTSHDEARLELFTYMEVYYNRVRRHSTLGYVSPLNYEQMGNATRENKFDIQHYYMYNKNINVTLHPNVFHPPQLKPLETLRKRDKLNHAFASSRR